jgi:hypothetical protein
VLANFYVPSTLYYPGHIPAVDFGLPVLIYFVAIWLLWQAGVFAWFAHRTRSKTANPTSPSRRFSPVLFILAVVLLAYPIWALSYCAYYFPRTAAGNQLALDLTQKSGVSVEISTDSLSVPPAWLIRITQTAAPNYYPSEDPPKDLRSKAAAWFLHFSHPAGVYRNYLPAKHIYWARVSSEEPEQLRLVSQCHELRVLSASFNPVTPEVSFNPTDFDGFRTMYQLQHFSLIATIQDSGFTQAVLIDKPHLTDLDLQTGGCIPLHKPLSNLGQNCPALEEVNISGAALSDPDLLGISGCAHLHTLTLDAVVAQGPGIQALSTLKNLKKLTIYFGGPNSRARMNALGSLVGLTALTVGLSNQPVDDPALCTALASLVNLTALDIEIPHEQKTDIPFLGSIPGLVTLSVRGHGCATQTLSHALAQNPTLQSLEISNIAGATDGDLSFLQTLPSLVFLTVSYCPKITGDFLKNLPRGRALMQVNLLSHSTITVPNIDKVNLARLQIELADNFDVASLQNLARHPTLTYLYLRSQDPMDGACKYFATMPALESLHIMAKDVASVEVLFTSKSLKEVSLHGLSEKEVQTLRDAHPTIKIN